MTILQLQRRIAEVGRIRIGQQVATGSGKKRPAKLDTFRLTSPNRTRVEQAARLYGGQVTEWEVPAGNQWEVVTAANALAVIVPPSDMAFSQHYELWSGGGCQRRCDGVTESISDGPCVCNPDNRECAIHTRLSVMLRDLPGLGIWRIDTSGYYAAVELQGAVDVMQMAARQSAMLPAQLRLEQRMVKRGGQTRRFPVPVLDVEISPAQLVSGTVTPQLSDPGVVAIEAPAREITDGSSPLTPVPETVPESPVASVQEQATAKRTSRRRAQSVPSTGIKPRTAEEARSRSKAEPPPVDEPPPPADEPPPPPPADDNPGVTKPQLQKLSILRQKEGYNDDDQGRTDWFNWVQVNIGRRVDTNKDLSKAEASVLIDVLENAEQQDNS